ncbi:hypothetical protein BGX27_007477 [Mortierella sp. AM989]|nr:hypothetical protein BGX27_007477 [Mortierella sp. AM989]
MKVYAYSLVAGAIALTATALAKPSFYRRAVDQASVIGCFGAAIVRGTMTPDCQTAVKTDVGIIQTVSFLDLNINMVTPDPNVMVVSSTGVFVDLVASPYGFPGPLMDSSQDVTIDDGGVDIAQFITPVSKTTVNANRVSTVIGDSVLTILPGKSAQFVAFMVKLLTQVSVEFRLKGYVNSTISYTDFLGTSRTLDINYIGYSSPIALRGFNSFPTVTFVSQDDLVKDEMGQYILTVTVNIVNPSQLVLNMGDISFNAVNKEGKAMGVVTFKGLKLVMGDNIVVATVVLPQGAYDVLTVNGATITFAGFTGSSTNPILAESMKDLKVDVEVPKLESISNPAPPLN